MFTTPHSTINNHTWEGLCTQLTRIDKHAIVIPMTKSWEPNSCNLEKDSRHTFWSLGKGGEKKESLNTCIPYINEEAQTDIFAHSWISRLDFVDLRVDSSQMTIIHQIGSLKLIPVSNQPNWSILDLNYLEVLYDLEEYEVWSYAIISSP